MAEYTTIATEEALVPGSTPTKELVEKVPATVTAPTVASSAKKTPAEKEGIRKAEGTLRELEEQLS